MSQTTATTLTASATMAINASPSEIWKAITTPELVKKYFFGTDTVTDWKPGSPITWKGEWKGKSYTDKGTVLNFEPERLLRFTYLSSMSGKEDVPENYATVTYQLKADGDKTIVIITQDNIDTEESREKMGESWTQVLKSLKDLVEKK